jgi:hypothetical protein
MSQHTHAHVSVSSRDCDGGHGYEYVATLNDDERAEHERQDGVNDFHEINFRSRIVGNVVNSYAIEEGFTGTLTVTAFGLDYHEPTEEGFTSTEVRWCEDESCNPDQSSQYDQYAEMDGY